MITTIFPVDILLSCIPVPKYEEQLLRFSASAPSLTICFTDPEHEHFAEHDSNPLHPQICHRSVFVDLTFNQEH